jgi:aquaporin Z
MRKLYKAFLAEFLGTALLVAVGLSIVIAMFGTSSPMVTLMPDPGLRRLVTGFLFGSTGALIAVSRIGKVSGAHINPVVSLSFWMLGKIDAGHAVGYMVAQCVGAIFGAVPLLLWGNMGESVAYGATLPGAQYGDWMALGGEVVTTFALIVGLFVFIGHNRLKAYTPLLFPFLYAVMVYLEAPVSGTSTNPARTLGPAVVANAWQGWWVYLAGPVTGAGLGTVAKKYSFLNRLEIEVAKVYHFKHDPLKIFRGRVEKA